MKGVTGKPLSAEEVAILKTQDANYIRMKHTHETRVIEKMQDDLHMVDSHKNTHIVFADSREEGQ